MAETLVWKFFLNYTFTGLCPILGRNSKNKIQKRKLLVSSLLLFSNRYKQKKAPFWGLCKYHLTIFKLYLSPVFTGKVKIKKIGIDEKLAHTFVFLTLQCYALFPFKQKFF